MFKPHTAIFALLFIVLGLSPTFGQVEQLSLSDAIQAGLANNFQMQIADRRTEIARNNNNYQQAGRYPNVTLNLNSGNNFSDINNPASFLNGLSLTTLGVTPSVDMQWVLFDGYKVRINKQRLEQLEQQTLGNKELIVENTIQAIILAYYRAAVEQQKIGIVQEVLQLSRDRYEYEQTRREIGVGNTFNVLQTQDAYLNDSINLELQRATLENAIQNLNLAMGLEDLRKNYALSDLLNTDSNVYDADALEEKLFASNQNLKNQFLNLQLLKTETEFQESNRNPRLTMGTGMNYALSQNYLGDRQASGRTFQYYLNFSLSYNLYDAGRTKRAIQNAIVNEQIGQLTIADQKRSLRSELLLNLNNYRHQADIIALNGQRIEGAKASLDIAKIRFESGVISSFDYRTVQIRYIQAAITQLEASFNLKSTEIQIARLTGGIISYQ